jgi:hypothetical protein
MNLNQRRKYGEFAGRPMQVADAHLVLSELRLEHGDDCIDMALACAAVCLTGLVTERFFQLDAPAAGRPTEPDAA